MPMWSFSFRAFSYFARSDFPFHDELAASQTHLSSPLIESFHLASHVTVSTWTTSPQLCFLPSPMSGTGGTFARFPMLIVMSWGGGHGVKRIAPNCAELRGAPDAVLEDGDPRAREAEKVLRRRRDVARRRAAAAAAVARSAFVRVVLVSRRLLLRPRGATPVALRRVAVAVARRLLAALPGEPRAEHVARELLLRVRLRRAERPQLAAALGAGGVVLEVLLLLGDLGREGGGGERVEEVGGWRRGGGV